MDYVSTEELEKIGIKVEEDGIYIVKAERVDSYDASSIEQKLLQLGVLEAPYSDIIDLFKKHLKNPTKVADSFVEYEAGKNEFIRVTVSKDALEAYLDVTFPSTDIEKISDRDILHKIYEAEITYNIDREKLNQIVRNRIFVEKEIIAQGEESIIGEEAQIVLEVDTDISTEPLVNEDGSVDFHQISLLKTVEKDQLLAVKIPATKGKDGMDVFGKFIDSTGKDKLLPLGKNTYISEDGLSLYSLTIPLKSSTYLLNELQEKTVRYNY